MQPRQMRDTFTPVEPRLTYSIAPQARAEMRPVKPRHSGPPALGAGVGLLGGPSHPSDTPVPPEQHPSPCLVSVSFQARFRLVSGLFQASPCILSLSPDSPTPSAGCCCPFCS